MPPEACPGTAEGPCLLASSLIFFIDRKDMKIDFYVKDHFWAIFGALLYSKKSTTLQLFFLRTAGISQIILAESLSLNAYKPGNRARSISL
jgi:hypothetical protein